MKTIIFSLMMLFLCSCNNDESNDNFNATVIGAGECGYLIKFDDNIDVPINSSQNIFYESNLPSQFKVKGLRINVAFRSPTNNELKACTTRDYSFPQIFIERVIN